MYLFFQTWYEQTVDSHLTDNMIPCSVDKNCNNVRGLTQVGLEY